MTENDKKYSVRTADGDVLLATNSIARARRLIEKLSGPVYLQYEAAGIRDFIKQRRRDKS